MSAPAPGRLVVVVPPPVGIEPSARAIEVLAGAAHVWWEDTPEAAGLLGAAPVPLDRRSPVVAGTDPAEVVARVRAGAAVALVGGGPLGAPLVGAVVDARLPVEVAPAPAATVAALVTSGLATDRVAVQGTPPAAGEPRTTAVPVSGAALAATLAELVEACGPDRPVAVAGGDGELWRGSAAAAAAWAGGRDLPGDVVLVVGGAPAAEGTEDHGDDAVREALRAARARGLSPGRAAAEVAAALGRPRREVYALGAEDGA